MQGRLFTLLDVAFPSYFVLLLTGFVFATVMGALWARRIGHDPDVVVDLGLAMLLAGVAGARVLHVLADGYFWDYVHLCTQPDLVEWKISYAECVRTSDPGSLGSFLGETAGARGRWDAAAGVCRPLQTDCWAWARFWAGGLTYYGGFIGASLAAWYLLRTDRFPFWKAADMAGLVVPVGLGFGRLGCLLAGCCFGKPWDSSLAVVFPPGSAASEAEHRAGLLESSRLPSLPVHPAQLYEAAAALSIAAFLLFWLHGRKRYDGQIFVAFVGLYAAARFVLEWSRADDRGGVLGLSTSQLIGAILVGVAWLAHQKLREKSVPVAAKV
jgi:phosphatidylglycerol:prolipoprotein diacylglycerol transferase